MAPALRMHEFKGTISPTSSREISRIKPLENKCVILSVQVYYLKKEPTMWHIQDSVLLFFFLDVIHNNKRYNKGRKIDFGSV